MSSKTTLINRSFFWVASATFAIILLTYSNHFHNEFHFDDFHAIVNNASIRDLGNIPRFFADCTTASDTPSHQGYRPIVTTSLAFNYSINGLDPFLFHVFNFVCHLLVSIVVFFILYHFYSPLLSLLGAAWFALSTAHAETVNYIIARSDILSTLAVTLSFALYLYFEKSRKYHLYLIPVSVGLLAKEQAIMFAPALIMYDFIFEQTDKNLSSFLRSISNKKVPLLVCSGLGLFTVIMTNHHVPGGPSVFNFAITQPFILLHYVIQFLFPFGLSADSDFEVITSLADDRLWIGFSFLAALIASILICMKSKKTRVFAFGVSWFLLMLLPTSSFIPLADVTNDHRMYLPDLGILMVILYGFNNVTKRAWSYAAICLVIILNAVGTFQRNKVWRTDESLWKDVTEKSPNGGRGWMNYGLALMNKGNLREAEDAFQSARTLTPNYFPVYINLGVLSEASGFSKNAESDFMKAIELGSDEIAPYFYYARFLFHQKRYQEAKQYCEKALSKFAGHIDTRHLLMKIYDVEKDFESLKKIANETLRLYPSDPISKGFYQRVQDDATSIKK